MSPRDAGRTSRQIAADSALRAVVMGAVILLATGCAPSREVRQSGITEDFIIDVTTLTGESAKDGLRLEARQGKWVMLPDGVLLAGEGPSIKFDRKPARVRVLAEAQVADMRTTASQLGFLNLSAANGVGDPSSVEPGADEVMCILWFRDQGKEWWFVRRWKQGSTVDPAAAQLIRTIGMLSWAQDLPADAFEARRYDFGPDPYAQYRAGRTPTIDGSGSGGQ